MKRLPKNKLPSRQRIRYTMSRVPSSGSAIENRLGKALWAHGLRYRRQYHLPGKPDFALVSDRVAVFCDSEFWHGYRWGRTAKLAFRSNRSYWIAKIERNRARDKRVTILLRRAGWKVIRFWERQIEGDPGACAKKVATTIAGGQKSSPWSIRRIVHHKEPTHR